MKNLWINKHLRHECMAFCDMENNKYLLLQDKDVTKVHFMID